MSEDVKIDGIPIQDYGTPNSRSCYPGEIQIGETIKSNIDYWKNLYFEEREKRNDVEEKLKIAVAMLTKGTYPEQNEGDNDFEKQFISKDKIRKILQKDYRYSNNLINEFKELLEEK